MEAFVLFALIGLIRAYCRRKKAERKAAMIKPLQVPEGWAYSRWGGQDIIEPPPKAARKEPLFTGMAWRFTGQ